MKRHPVQSRTFKSAGYDPTCSIMEIEYANGRVEQFLGVPAKTWQTFLMSNEKESWFSNNIKSSFFKVSVS
ncbi:KTSC domain-containing protein [Cronobacter malonaticus]|uniref:KTSC domain-containing protein n=3 Tax=Cronobacter TaxID=413496 RepID=A0A2T7AZT6_9ENTR|nr:MULTISPECIES: KTSC domain-containing protein [Cronobacter]MEB8538731.1 KTSC domain-containing protein [Cronobacter sakazakii]CCJ91756.1 FIG00553569: hypothetical protein [Cronobacter turicensis 564]ALB55962.1 hypothetical protein AFK65_15335 [Cronobacter universalis NCTC 9529]EGT4494295.1 KTSC domain-containing protein [Cronobacter turicensis]EKM0361506.1 KTSC domain-containing protein [Cronobacter turicensis]